MKSKKLTLREMWELHKTIKYVHQDTEVYLVDSVLGIMKGMTEKDFSKSLQILYGDVKIGNGIIAANMLIDGIKSSNFLGFEDFIKAMQHGTR